MSTLSKKLMIQFYNELLLLPRAYYKEIYQIKTIHSKLGDSILFSCRFKTKTTGTFLLSICIVLKRDAPHVRASVHQFCDRRIFSKMIYRTYIALPVEQSVSGILNIQKYNDYYKMNRQLPYKILAVIFKRNGREDLIAFIDKLEGLDNGTD